MWFGFLILMIGQALIGTAPHLKIIPNKPGFVLLGLCFIGLGFSTVIIPVFPEILEAAELKLS